MNKFQEFNNNLIQGLRHHLGYINKSLTVFFKHIAEIILRTLAIILMLSGSLPILIVLFYAISVISGHTLDLHIITLVKFTIIGVVGWYLGTGIQLALKD